EQEAHDEMKRYGLADRFRDNDLERAVLAAIARDSKLYWTLLDSLPVGVFAGEGEAWGRVRDAVEKNASPEVLADAVPAEWPPSADPTGDAERLADLHQRRLLAGAQERLAEALNNDDVTASELAQRLEEEALKAQRAIRELDSGRLQLASALARSVVADARERYEARRETGKPVMGIKTGIGKLDEITGGLEEGLYLLGAAPGFGKTTLAAQITRAVAAEGDPVVYASFENSAQNLVLKMLCARAKVNSRDVRRGKANPNELARAAAELAPVLDRIAVVEGTGRLTVAEVRGRALQMMHRTGRDKCLIVVDYLQLWAKASAELRGMISARERVEALAGELRQLATRLKSPVLAIVSQNRAQGDYGANGKGAPTLDSLKESGDLEYAADVVMFLHRSQDRTAMEPTRAVDLTVAKNRNGELGKVELIFRANIGDMEEEDKRGAA
ncbi:MAG: DnaB helicase C-terminal domain-containing protein, partial [Actinomycetota bacterium]|nr:DnaB helicase C-terminal domain-containing protein [Actinomycetota bacterium]